jgi:hypothetical protein
MANYQFKNKDYSFRMERGIEDKVYTAYTVSLKKVEFTNFKLANVLEIVLNKPSKYFLKNKIDGAYVNINFINNHQQTKTKQNLEIVSEELQKKFKVKFKKQLIKKEVLELYIADSLKYKKAISALSSKESCYSFKQVSRHLDSQYSNHYFVSTSEISSWW